jgi:hypothetical protein
MSDITAITQLILRERQGRDRGWWDQMRTAFRPDSTVRLSWFTGSGPEFVERSEAMSSRGDLSVHRMAPPAIAVHGDRAHAEASASIELQIDFDGVAAHLISFTRINYRLSKEDGEWGVVSLDAIYERDTLTPALPGASLKVDPADVAGFRPSYALLALYLERRGYPIGADLLGDDRPGEVAAFYESVHTWLAS